MVEDTSGEDDIVFYYLYIEMPDGKIEKKKYWNRKFYDSFSVGNTIIKRAGERHPVKG